MQDFAQGSLPLPGGVPPSGPPATFDKKWPGLRKAIADYLGKLSVLMPQMVSFIRRTLGCSETEANRAFFTAVDEGVIFKRVDGFQVRYAMKEGWYMRPSHEGTRNAVRFLQGLPKRTFSSVEELAFLCEEYVELSSSRDRDFDGMAEGKIRPYNRTLIQAAMHFGVVTRDGSAFVVARRKKNAARIKLHRRSRAWCRSVRKRRDAWLAGASKGATAPAAKPRVVARVRPVPKGARLRSKMNKARGRSDDFSWITAADADGYLVEKLRSRTGFSVEVARDAVAGMSKEAKAEEFRAFVNGAIRFARDRGYGR